MFRGSVVFAALAMIALLALPGMGQAAITGSVFMDYNSNGARDAGGFEVGTAVTATDVAVAGVPVSAYDAVGTRVSSTTTAADGTYTLCASGCSGAVRVEFGTPATDEPSFAGTQNGTSVRFVADGASGVDYAITNAGTYCQDNPALVTCLQQATGMVGNPSFAARPGAFQVPAQFLGPNVFDQLGGVDTGWPGNSPTDDAIIAPFSSIGATFGIGVDRNGNAYYGTFVKRHSPYGPEGAVNAVYRVNIATGQTSTFAILGSSTLPAHVQTAPAGWPDYAADGYRSDGNTNDVFHLVGRAGLGDVDVTPDGSTLLAVEMTEGASKLWRVPINGTGNGVTAGTATSIAIPAPTTFGGTTCVGGWHPMAIGVKGSRILVGGVCGGTEGQWMADPSDLSVNSRTDAAAFILETDSSFGAFQTIAALSLDYPKGRNNDNPDEILSWNNAASGLWRNWYDGTAPGGGPPMGQPMLANIEIMGDGDLVLAFRDRANDQTKSGSISYDASAANPTQTGNTISAAEVLRLCAGGPGSYTPEVNGACGADTGANVSFLMSSTSGTPSAASLRANSPLFYAAGYWTRGYTSLGHSYTSLGGATTMPGASYLWTTNFDPDDITAQGLRAYGPCDARVGAGDCGPAGAEDGAGLATIELSWGTYGWPGPGQSGFGKGNGLGDLEMVCDAAPVQIGNRIWIDTDRDGVQDPDEPAVAGVTVHLYDAAGTLVGTAITDADGAYYFSSNVTAPAAGDGSNAGGGLTAGATFTLKLDNPSDFAAGGPLHGYTLTGANATTQGDAANSKATLQDGSPTITVGARSAGQNDHRFDIGFIAATSDDDAGSGSADATTTLVAVGNYVWIDGNRNGLQGERRPLRGVYVVLLTANGKRARDASGKLVRIKRTNRKGYYNFDGLAPGRYRVRFVLPAGYRFTKQGVRNAKRNSNPRATKRNPLVGVTPIFRVYGKRKGTTIRNRNRRINASFINPTIDAGVVRSSPLGGGEGVTG